MKLNIGGLEPKDGWEILNISNDLNVDYVGDINDLTQFESNSIDEIYASHVIEHVPQAKVLIMLEGVYRILKQGGKFHISVPDLDILCHTFISPIASPDQKKLVMRMMFGGQVDEHDYHYFGWNQLFLFDYLRQANFSNAERVQSLGIFNDTSDHKPFGFPISLNVVATK
tara:strand:- start:1340 stop:1849 length:510 start_codon:yes stop_codon:yes gene_type:complete